MSCLKSREGEQVPSSSVTLRAVLSMIGIGEVPFFAAKDC